MYLFRHICDTQFTHSLCRYTLPRGPPKTRHRKPPPKYDMNGNAPNGIPLQTRVPNGVMGTPHGTQRSNRSKQLGSHRGPPGPLRFTAGPPGLYRSMMAPHFMYPPYQQVIYIDESEEDEHSVRSTMREHKRRYKRSFFSASRDASSKVEIKYVYVLPRSKNYFFSLHCFSRFKTGCTEYWCQKCLLPC